MNPISLCFLLAAGALLAVGHCSALGESNAVRQPNMEEEMQLINKSLEGLLSELSTIKREATGRLAQVRSKVSAGNEQERIRQTKVSRFVLKRVAELELESLGMRDEMVRLFELQRKTLANEQREKLAGRSAANALGKQEDVDFDDQPAAQAPSSTTTTTTTTTTSTTMKPSEQEEAAQIGFDLEQLKRLGAELESEIESRQAQGAESVRGVHEQVIKLVDNMVQNYLGNMRRAVQRFTNFIDNRRATGSAGSQQQQQQQQQPRESPSSGLEATNPAEVGAQIVGQLQEMTKRFREFTLQWSKTLGKQQSPLIDRIPPRGVELWRDFWDTVHKQVRRINQEVVRMTRDMGRLLTGRPPSTGGRLIIRPGGREGEPTVAAEQVGAELPPAASGSLGELLYAASSSSPSRDQSQEQVRQQFEEFYEKLTVQLAREQQRMNEMSKAAAGAGKGQQQQLDQNLFDELDDEVTRQELANNVALRQQIQQEINVFGSIFDIMRTFISRLRDSASTIRDILTPPGAIFDNNPVTPGPAVKPTVDKLLEETINSQRNINSQARPSSRD